MSELGMMAFGQLLVEPPENSAPHNPKPLNSTNNPNWDGVRRSGKHGNWEMHCDLPEVSFRPARLAANYIRTNTSARVFR